MRNIFAILLILASFGIYYGYTKNVFADVSSTKVQLVDLDATLAKADMLDEEKQSIQNTINSFNESDKEKLNTMIPDNADNVRLIINIQNIAQTSGLAIKDIKVNDEAGQTGQITNANTADQASGIENGGSDQSYNSVKLSFSVSSTYPNYVQFVEKLEQSLRLVDITSLAIKSTDNNNIYQFDTTLKAYWVK